MTRRLVFAIVGTVIAALLIAGLGTLVLSHLAARRDTQQRLLADTVQLASGLDELPVASGQQPLLARLRQLTRVLRLDGIETVRVTEDLRLVGALPPGASLSTDDLTRLRNGTPVGHSSRSLAWAAVPVGQRRTGALLGPPRHVTSGVRPAFGWFLVSSAFVLAIAAAVAIA